MTRVPELLLFLAGFAVLALPGVFAVSTLFPRQTVRERWIFGCALGLAAAVYLAVSLAYVRLWLFHPVWVLLGALALVAWLSFSLLFTAVLLTHHHVMLASGVVFAMLFVFLFAARRREARHRAILLGLLGSFVLGGFYIVPYALKATSVGSTGVLTFREMFYDLRTIAEAAGVAFLAASLAGVLVHRFARRPAAQLGVLYVVSGSLLALFVFFEYGWRAISPRFLGDTFVAFTPSRFLTDLVYFSSVFAGYALNQLHRLLRVPLVVVFAICLPVAATNRTAWAKASVPTGPPELLEAYRWIERHTPPDTLVLTNDRWAVYGTWRRCAVTPIPASEPSTVDTPKARMFNTLKRGAIPPEAAASKVVQVGLPGPALRPGRVLWRAPSGLVVVEVWPGAPSRAPG